mgnify:CR=1 FL=1
MIQLFTIQIKKKSEKINSVFIVKGKHQTAAGKLFTGDIGAIVKLQVTQTNDTLCEKGKQYLAEPIVFSEPMLAMAVYPNSKNDEDKMSNALARMCEEDSTLRLENNLETKQTILYGVGDQHLDVILNKLKSKYKCRGTFGNSKGSIIEKRFVKLHWRR